MSNKILVVDIETDSIDVKKANVKWFGAYSYSEDKYYLLKGSEKDLIQQLIKDHKYIIGFNSESFDLPIIEKFFPNVFEFKIRLDLYKILAPPTTYSRKNKGRLGEMGIVLGNYKLKTIVEYLKLDVIGKEEIDYKIFQKDDWSEKEEKLIKKYLKKDLEITKKLFDWYYEQFKDLKEIVDPEYFRKLKHLKDKSSVVGYNAICYAAGLEPKFADSVESKKSFGGGHNIKPRWKLVVGNIVSYDFASMYPHALIQGNLFSHADKGWSGNNYYQLKGVYDNKQQGKIETALKEILLERLKAKRKGNKNKSNAYKIIINSVYGITGNPNFIQVYDNRTCSDCTAIGRTWLKKLAKELEENGFSILFGKTDSLYIKIPKESSKEELAVVINNFIKNAKNNLPFPMETFNVELEKEIKLFYPIDKNNYFYIQKDNTPFYTKTLLNKNTPEIVVKVFEEYMIPKIIKNLDVNFTIEELDLKFREYLDKNIELTCEMYVVDSVENYNSKVSLYYQISKQYGAGKHLLIPNLGGVGIGRAKSTKKKVGLRYCTIEEFNKAKLSSRHVDISKLLKWLKPFLREKSSEKARKRQMVGKKNDLVPKEEQGRPSEKAKKRQGIRTDLKTDLPQKIGESKENKSEGCLGVVYPRCNEKIENGTISATETATETETTFTQLSIMRGSGKND